MRKDWLIANALGAVAGLCLGLFTARALPLNQAE